MSMKIINAKDCVVGRLASSVAKRLLSGEEIIIVNAEKSLYTGSPTHLKKKIEEKRSRGDPYHGPFYPRRAEKILRRTVRGMLPYHRSRGKNAFKRLKVYKSVPEVYKDQEAETIKEARYTSKCKFVYLEDLCKKIGG